MQERPPILVPRAAAVTAHPLATEAAIHIMRQGGTAADAVLAAGAVLTVVEPWASHIGGDAFALVWDAGTRRARAVQGSGIAPSAVDPAAIARSGGIPVRGPLPVTVPGLVGAWFHLHRTRGRLPIDRLFAPAIDLARQGLPANARWERVARLHRPVIEADPGLAALLLPDGRAVRQGDWIRQPDLAESLRGLALGGADHLYDGPLGARVVEAVRARGGVLDMKDLRGHATEEVDPLVVDLHGCQILEQPPVSQGVMVLAMLRVLDEADRRGWQVPGSEPRAVAQEAHLQIEAYLHARAYRDQWLCDPRFAGPAQRERIAHWATQAHALETLGRIDPRRAAAAGAPSPASDVRDTTSFCVVDPEGNVVSWIQSIFHPFGAGFVVPGTGILLNNRMTGFSLDPASPNRLEPGKRTVHTLNTWMVLREGSPWLAGGTPGGERQVKTNVQVLRARVARGQSLAEAVHAPRWAIDEQDRVAVEGRLPREVRRRLEDRGHRVVRIGPWEGSGFVQAVERLDSGGWLACTDPRGEGLAAGF